MEQFRDGELQVNVFENTAEMADNAARQVGDRIKALLEIKPEVNIVFSGAKSQQQFHQALAKIADIDWSRIHVFAVDDFYCPEMNPDFAVANQPKRDLYSKVNPKSIQIIHFNAPSPEAERSRYERLLKEKRPDIACLGIGISGHIAFNEPGQTDFNDPDSVKIITVTAESKMQLMTDPNFKELGIIPNMGITITISELMRCPFIFVIVPYIEKAPIIKRFFETEVTPDFPATVLKTKENAQLFLDADAFRLCKK